VPVKNKQNSFHHLASAIGAGANAVIREAMERESADNLSVVVLAFKNLFDCLKKVEIEITSDDLDRNEAETKMA